MLKAHLSFCSSLPREVTLSAMMNSLIQPQGGRRWPRMVHSLAQKACGRPEGKPSPMAITYTLMKLLRVKLLLRRKVLDVTTIRLENGCRNMQENMIFNLPLRSGGVASEQRLACLRLAVILRQGVSVEGARRRHLPGTRCRTESRQIFVFILFGSWMASLTPWT